MPKTTEDVSLRGVQYAEDFISNFSGQDHTYSVGRWIQDIEDNTEIFEWTPLQQLVIARRSLTGTAGLWLRSERPFKSWADLKQAISKEFPDAIGQKTIHEMMSARKKKSDEGYMDYLLIMKELGKRGKIPDYVAIKYIVDGIQDLETNKMLLYGVTSYSELKEKLKIYEQIVNKPNKKPVLSICVENTEEMALVDSGSDVNLMSQDFYEVIGQPKTTEDGIVLSGLGLKPVRSYGEFTTCAVIDGRRYDEVTFHVVPKDCMPYRLILGHEFLASVTMIMNGGSVLLLPSGEEWMRQMDCFTVGSSVVVGSTVSPTVRKEVLQCVDDYKPVQVKEAPIQLKIILKDDIPVAQKRRRLSLKEQQIVEDQVTEWLEKNIVRLKTRYKECKD
ncbi:unnamed protein product [Arctia plantaginis]|uniref:Peptidase A2 domain-containing protein n=1 Tax=Arctia plantaginis TaxID=874455 RepID=A0A8S0ZK20_ARCPL|nr:unnamed protein product [Arctia plantaginis]